MNDERGTPEDDLRAALAPDDTIAPLDPARVIAGARRRRKVRGLASAAVASVAVIGIAAGGLLATDRDLGNAPQPAGPGVTSPAGPGVPLSSPSPEPPRTSEPSMRPSMAPSPTGSPQSAVTAGESAVPQGEPSGPLGEPSGSQGSGTTPNLSDCLQSAATAGDPTPGPAAKLRGSLAGRLIVVADSNYWTACDNTFRPSPSARRPAKLRKPGLQDDDAFAVAGNAVQTPAGLRDFFWAAGMLPDGVATVRYGFADGAVVDAEVSNGFWMMRHVSTAPAGAPTPANRIRVQLLSPSDAVLKEFRLDWGTQTCAQISHGC
ncbi:hypothetical protein [Kribbella sp. CA-247076]|uniref:hypothetical protein n=1 Tax=Kribbella sp. CA-247076 TaxID=3239941 RepID=UPI003D8D2634